MKNRIHLLFVGMLIAATVGNQGGLRAEDSNAEPKVTGGKIIFPGGSLEASSIKVETVEAQNLMANHVAGHLVWNEELTVRIYTPVTGRVRQVLARVGDNVEAGAVLATLDSPDFGQAQADAHRASADLTLAKRNLVRLRELEEHGAIARKEVDAAEDVYSSAEAEQQRAHARLVLYGEKDANAVDGLYGLTAPIAGVVVERNVNAGEELRPDLMLANEPRFIAPQFVVTNPRQMWVALDATETELPFLRVGQPIKVRSRAYPEQVFAGAIETIGSSLDPSTRTVKVLGEVKNSDLVLKAELYVDVEIEPLAQDSGEVVIDSSSVFKRAGQACVFLETASGTYEVHPVKTGTESSGHIQVLVGLSKGQKVVSDGRLLLESMLDAGGNP